jgi:hypothetical protein
MSYKTVEVELENGRVQPKGAEALPHRARALLTILEPELVPARALRVANTAGLHRFLSSPDFELTPEQFRASMEADFFEQ